MRLISLASGTMPECDPVTVIEAAAAGGFGGCGIWFDAERWETSTAAAVKAAFDRTGIKPLEIEVIVIGDPDHESQHLQLLDAGAGVGATDAIVVSQQSDPGASAALLSRLDEHARPLGIHLCLEFLPIFAIRDLDSACAVLDRVDSDNLKILIDPLHVARSGAGPVDIGRVPGQRISFAQFCDAPLAAPDPGDHAALYDEALNGRLLPGDGQLPLAELLAVLPPDLPLSLEMRAAWLRQRYPDPVLRARAVYERVARWLADHGEPVTVRRR